MRLQPIASATALVANNGAARRRLPRLVVVGGERRGVDVEVPVDRARPVDVVGDDAEVALVGVQVVARIPVDSLKRARAPRATIATTATTTTQARPSDHARTTQGRVAPRVEAGAETTGGMTTFCPRTSPYPGLVYPPPEVLSILTYYHPHWTGLTTIAKSIAEGLSARGHQVTILAARHESSLARRDVLNGVRIVRLDPIFRISRGVVMPEFPIAARRLIRESDVVQIHTLPESLLVAALARRAHKRSSSPIRATRAPLGACEPGNPGDGGVDDEGRGAAGGGNHHSERRLRRTLLLSGAIRLEGHPDLPAGSASGSAGRGCCRLAAGLGLEQKRVVGFAGRFVEEKGFDVLLAAVPQRQPFRTLTSSTRASRWRYERFAERRPLLDASLNALEQGGAPSRPSAPGELLRALRRLRASQSQRVLRRHAGGGDARRHARRGDGHPRWKDGRPDDGDVVEPESPGALAAGLGEVLSEPARYRRTEQVRAVFDQSRSLDQYESLLERLAGRRAA